MRRAWRGYKKAPASTEAWELWLSRYDDVTGVLMQCISRIPLSYRRKCLPARRSEVFYD